MEDQSQHCGISNKHCKNSSIEMEEKNANKRLKHMTENYEVHINNILPEYLHRGDIVSTNRLLGYSDAMMATCATFLVLPFRNLKEMGKDQTLEEYMHEKRTEFIMFVIGFLVICTIWECNNVRSIIIKRLDDFLVLLSILSMMVTTVLPFSLALQGNFPKEKTSIIITTVVLLLIEVLEMIMIIYAFASPRLLHYALSKWSKQDLRRFLRSVALKPIFNFILVTVAGLSCLLDYHVSWVLFAIIILTPLARKLLFYVRRRIVHPTKKEKSEFFWFFTKGNISKERVETFTDAATAIIACVLILDITVEEFPKEDTVKHHGMVATLEHMKVELKIFFGTYAMVSLLWYVNHTILHLFHTITVVTLYLQKIFLVFLCMVPLYSNMLMTFVSHHNDNSHTAIIYTSLITFAAGMCNLLMLFWGFYRRERVFHRWASQHCLKANMKQHLYVLLKTINIPFWSLISFFVSFAHGAVPSYTMIATFIAMIVTFIVLKVCFLNHVGKEGISQFEKSSSDDVVGKESGQSNEIIGRKDSSMLEFDERRDTEILNREHVDEELSTTI